MRLSAAPKSGDHFENQIHQSAATNIPPLVEYTKTSVNMDLSKITFVLAKSFRNLCANQSTRIAYSTIFWHHIFELIGRDRPL